MRPSAPRMARRWIPPSLRRMRDRPAQAPDLGRELIGVDETDRRTIERCLPYTMTGVMRLRAVIDAVRHCEAVGLPGAFAECGVWRGGSVLAMIATLQAI